MKRNWKPLGLLASLALQGLFLFLYLSLRLVDTGSPFADILWLLCGTSGIFFGIINYSARKWYCKALAAITLTVGIIITPLWFVAVFVASM